jgi:hypothetical protein
MAPNEVRMNLDCATTIRHYKEMDAVNTLADLINRFPLLFARSLLLNTEAKRRGRHSQEGRASDMVSGREKSNQASILQKMTSIPALSSVFLSSVSFLRNDKAVSSFK